MAIKRHTLDYNHLFRLKLDYDRDTQQLRVAIMEDSEPGPRLYKNILRQLNVWTPNLVPETLGRKIEGDTLVFSPVRRQFSLKLGNEIIGEYTIDPSGALSRDVKRHLTVDETRSMGTFHEQEPYPQKPEDRDLIKVARNAVFTDFHTHSSGQITPTGLLEIAMPDKGKENPKPYYYPVDLLREAGISTTDISKDQRRMIDRVAFTPKDIPGVEYPPKVEAINLYALTDEDLNKLKRKMAMPADHQVTTTEMEYDGYRFRYPFTKDTSLLKAMLKKTAQEYALKGIQYAELSFVGLDNPKNLKIIHETMEEIRNDPATKDVTMRFLAGIPRDWPLERIKESLEKTKILSQSPYIVGVDFLGHEVTKTKEFVELFDQFADWANQNKPGFTLRVHAGENSKNPDNVKEFLQMAVNHKNLHFRVGHGVYGMKGEALKLARQLSQGPNPRLTVELNPCSNLSLNNIDHMNEVPYKELIDNGIPFIIGSDSSGMYQTDALQLGLAAYYGGLGAKGFELLREHQMRLMQQQIFYSANTATAIPQWDQSRGKTRFVDSLIEQLSAVPKAIAQTVVAAIDPLRMETKLRNDEVTLIQPGELAHTPELMGKAPITLFGAAGAGWSAMSPIEKRETAIAIDMLLHALDPDKVYITQGRTKKSGMSRVVANAANSVKEERQAKDKRGFYMHGLQVQPDFSPNQSYKHLDFLEVLPGKLLNVADGLVNHTMTNNGTMIGFGGLQFSRDIITKADMADAQLLLLSKNDSASGKKAKVLNPKYDAPDGQTLLRKLHALHPEWFREGFRTASLGRYYVQSKERVSNDGPSTGEPSQVTGTKELLASRSPKIVKRDDRTP